jgi:hypothetical protein
MAHAAARSLKEAQAQLILKLADLVADGGWGDAKFARGLGKTHKAC